MLRWLIFIPVLFFTTLLYSQAHTIHSLKLEPGKVVKHTGVKDQYLSATCWSFASNSLLESELLRNKKDVDLSEMFVARYSMIRKIERHLALKGANFFTPGGQFHDMVWVMKNYGMVPESAYPGKPRGEEQHFHGELDTTISYFIKDMLAEGVTKLNRQQRHFVDSVLDYYLGPVPQQFIYQGKSYTPKSFLAGVLQIKADDYVEITSYTHHPYYSRFILEDKYNWTADKYYNVPLEDFENITDQALLHGYSVGWDGDATDELFSFDLGLANLNIEQDYTKARQAAFEDQTTLLDHMMHIVGLTKDVLGRKWYYVKNSWGDANHNGGYLYMDANYFRIRTVAIIVNKNAIPATIRKKMGL